MTCIRCCFSVYLVQLIYHFLLFVLLQAWHTYKGYHAMPIYLNSLNNAILRANLPENYTNHSQYGMYTFLLPALLSLYISLELL